MATLDPRTPAGRLLMFKKDILPGRIQTAEHNNTVYDWAAVDAARAEIRRLERELNPTAAARNDAYGFGPSRFRK